MCISGLYNTKNHALTASQIGNYVVNIIKRLSFRLFQVSVVLKDGPPKVHQYVVQLLKRYNCFFASLGHFLGMYCREHRPIYLLEGKDGFLYDSLCRDRLRRQFTCWVKRLVISISLGNVSKN